MANMLPEDEENKELDSLDQYDDPELSSLEEVEAPQAPLVDAATVPQATMPELDQQTTAAKLNQLLAQRAPAAAAAPAKPVVNSSVPEPMLRLLAQNGNERAKKVLSDAYGPDLNDQAIQKALQTKHEKEALAGLGLAANQVANANAMRSGGKVDVDTPELKAYAASAGNDLNDIATRRAGIDSQIKQSDNFIDLGDKDAKADPTSTISQVYRDLIKKANILPEGTMVPESVSASQLEKLAPWIKKLVPGNGKDRFSLREIRDPKTGENVTVAIDVTDPSKITPIGVAGRSYQTKTDAFGNVLGFDPSKGIGAKGGFSSPITILKSSSRPDVSEISDKDAKAFRPDIKQQENLDKETARLDDLSKGANQQLSGIRGVRTLLHSGSKLTASAIRTRMPRVMGEVGNLNESEQSIWGGAQDALSRADQYLSTLGNSELTDSNVKEFEKLLNAYEHDGKQALNTIFEGTKKKLEAVSSIPQKFTEKAIKPNWLQAPSYGPDVIKYAKDHGITPEQAQAIKDKRTSK